MVSTAMALGTGAATSAAHPFGIFVHGLDVAKEPGTPGGLFGADITSLVIKERLGEAHVADFDVDDPGAELSIRRDDDVYIVDHAGRSNSSGARVTDDLFRGFVENVTRRPMSGAGGWTWHVTALSLEALLDTRYVEAEAIPAGTMDAGTAIQQIVSTLDPRISALAQDPAAISVSRAGAFPFGQGALIVAQTSLPIPVTVPIRGKTYRRAIQDVIAASRDPAQLAAFSSFDFYARLQVDVDVQGRIRYGQQGAGSIGLLPYGSSGDATNIIEGASAPSSRAAPSNVEVVPDLTGYVSRVYVQGADDASSGWVISPTEATYGRRDAWIYADTATDAASRDAAGYAYLSEKRPIIRVLLTLSDSHDRLIPNPAPSNAYTGWHVRSYSSIRSDSGLWEDPSLASGTTGLLWEITKRFDGGTHMTMELGFGGGRISGGSLLATRMADAAQATRQAGRLVGSLDEAAIRVKSGVPTDADFAAPRDGLVVVDDLSAAVWARIAGAWVCIAAEPVVGTQGANVNVTALTEGTADTIVTAPAYIADGIHELAIRFYCYGVRPDSTVAARELTFVLYEDGASIGLIGLARTPAANTDYRPTDVTVKRTPAAGAHTYSIRAFVNGGTGIVSAGAGGAGTGDPARIEVRYAV